VKLGAENRTKVIAAISLGAVAVLLLAVEFSGWLGANSSSAAAPPTTPGTFTINPAPRQAGGRNAAGRKTNTGQSLDPSLRYDLLKTSEDTKYEGTGRNIFRVFVEPPPRPIVNPVLDHQQAAAPTGPPPPPPPPPIELKFYGFATPSGGVKRIFLAHGEDVFIAKEGEIVDRRYKVVRISPNSVDILDVLSNNRQSIPLTQG
jgi:hypothetical protein